MYTFRPLSPLAKFLIESFQEKETLIHEERRVTVNPIVSKFASWYEKLRNVMEFREEEVILRASIERILKRRLLLGGNGKTAAEPLVKELLWARYLPEHEVGRSIVTKVEESIDLHLALRLKVLVQHRISEALINEWIYDIMSADIQYIINPKREKELMANFMFHVLRDDVVVEDDSEETKNAQIYLAIRKSFARDDLPFLRYHMFCQYFGRLTPKNLDDTAENFMVGFKEILRELQYPLKEQIQSYIKKRTAAFFILEDVLRSQSENLKTILESEEELQQVVTDACTIRYKSIASRVRTAVIRSVCFILLTKVCFAFAVEGTYEKLVFPYHIIWQTMIMNIAIPPLLMVIVSLFIQTPGVDNSKLILKYINILLYDEKPRLGSKLITSNAKIKNAKFNTVFNILWLFAFILSFGAIIIILTKLHFNPVSQFIFIFFVAIVSFLSYRIGLLANLYRVGERQGMLTLLVDFLFMPVIRVGQKLTQNIAKINLFLYIFDFFIEAPFKSVFAFFDQWFFYLHAKTEELE